MNRDTGSRDRAAGRKKGDTTGPEMEERLRHYFIGLNYFVLRGVKYRYNQFDVTDIDLWLYSRTSPLSRERINVDAKNRRTPQALERIFWTKGIQLVIRAERCIVATTDSRPDVTEFGLRNGVAVLDGRFLARLEKSDKSHRKRLTEEDYIAQVDQASLGRLGGNWRGRYQDAKSRVLSSLNFDGCNAWLNDIRYFFEQAQMAAPVSMMAWRIAYLCIALFLVAVDFISRDLLSLDAEQRKARLADGFRYGESGRAFTDNVARVATTLVSSTSTPAAGEALRAELDRQAKEVRADLIAEFLSKSGTQASLFELAREFEQAAFSIDSVTPTALPANCQAIIGVLADFFALDRKRVLV